MTGVIGLYFSYHNVIEAVTDNVEGLLTLVLNRRQVQRERKYTAR